MSSFWIADPHLDHSGILRHCKRPWLRPGDLDEQGKWISKSIADERTEEMNEAIVDLWNKKVPASNSTVYIAGDFSWGAPDKWLGRLHGKKILCLGNHDPKGLLTNKRGFTEVHQILDRKIEGKWMIICHFPLAAWNGSCNGSWNIHGHTHCRYVPPKGSLQLDVGVDGHGFIPWDEEEISAAMMLKIQERQFLPDEDRKFLRF